MATVADLEAQVAALQASMELMNTTLSMSAAAQQLDNTEAFNHMWLLICGALVMLMQAGFALLEAGLCREKNVQSVLMKNVLDCCVGTLAWYAVGWALAYGNVPENGFAGSEEFLGAGFLPEQSGALSPTGSPNSRALDWFFQWAFCNTASTIVSGGVAERLQIGGYVLYTAMMTGVIYPVVVAWTWSGSGWLGGVGAGYLDFAGSGIVHLTGGVGALAGSMIVGKRKGRFEGDQADFEAHNLAFVVLGTFVLWFGWYGFNCGSTLGMDGASGKLAAQVAMNTTLAASCGGLAASVCAFVRTKKWDLASTCSGILAGLVSITAGCGNVTSGSAIVIGAIGGCLYYAASALMKRLQIDDPIDAFAVHGVCGFWGTLCVALFDWGKGGFWGASFEGPTEFGMGDALLANLVGALAIVAWSGGLSALLFGGLKATGWLRVDGEIEATGMDAHEFVSPKAYRTTVWSGESGELAQAEKTEKPSGKIAM